ncbi:MAG: acyl-CoA thioesterase [Bacteroidetes bacterium]|nr:acyl-CoA thioesterase [Bacteroidota bacterium]
MSEPGVSSTTDIRVRYAETDAMKVVYHGNYLPYFEEARTALFRSIGLTYSEIEREGFYLVVLEVHAQYKRSAVYDDVLHVKASLRELPAMRITIHYEITRNNEPEVLVTGETVHAFVNAASGRPIRPPKEYLTVMQRYFPS